MLLFFCAVNFRLSKFFILYLIQLSNFSGCNKLKGHGSILRVYIDTNKLKGIIYANYKTSKRKTPTNTR